MPYTGNKRSECEDILKVCEFENITTIVEPFCGSCAFSFYIASLFPKKFKYILNDNCEQLINIMKIMKDENKYNEFKKDLREKIKEIKEKKDYDRITKENNLISWFIKNKFYNIRPGLYAPDKKMILYDDDKYEIIKFLRTENIELVSGCGKELIERIKDDTDKLIFIDPPYLSTVNHFYENTKTNIYEYLYLNNPINFKSKMVFALEDIWITRLLFKDLINNNNYQTKDKQYQTSKKKTTHIYFNNKKIS